MCLFVSDIDTESESEKERLWIIVGSHDFVCLFDLDRPLTGEVAEAIGTNFAAETNRRDEDAEM